MSNAECRPDSGQLPPKRAGEFNLREMFPPKRAGELNLSEVPAKTSGRIQFEKSFPPSYRWKKMFLEHHTNST
jgi:hypothetical protein